MPPNTAAKTLLLMRHAKSDWDAEYDRDHDRPLSERGLRSARLMGRLLQALDLTPDLVLTSTAVRARDTARLAAETGGWQALIVEQSDFYGGSPDTVLEIASRTGEPTRLMLIGHEPVWSALARRLGNREVEMKTATVAVFETQISDWADLPGAKGVMVALHHPRDYFGSEWDHD